MISFYRLDLLSFGVAVATGVILGFIVYFRDRKSVTNKLFLLFTLISSMWGVFNYLAYQISDPIWSLWIVRLVMFLAVFQSLTFYLLMRVFPEAKSTLSRKFILPLLFVVVVVSVFTLTPFVFSDVLLNPGAAPSPKPAPGIGVFAITSVGLVVGGIVTMLRKIRHSEAKIKSQFKMLFFGVLIMFASIILFNFILVAFLNNSAFIPFSGIFILPFVLFTFIAIARYELLDIRIIGTEVITILLVITSFVEVILASSFGEVLFRSGVFIALLIVGVLLIRSVVREVRQREKLQELNLKLQEMDKQKDEFVNMAAHELRSPLTAIKGYVSMIIEGDTGDIPEKARQYLADSMAVTDRLVRLVNNMLNVSRIEEGRIVYQMEDTSLIRAVQEVYYSNRIEAERKGLKFILDIPNGLSDTVYVDPDRIREVIGNIVSNAVKFTEEGKIELTMSNPREGVVKVAVSDTGPGISEEEQQKLFAKFYRAESTAGKTFGTGLGLYITKLLIDNFGGKIGLESEVDKGTTFWFELPVKS